MLDTTYSLLLLVDACGCSGLSVLGVTWLLVGACGCMWMPAPACGYVVACACLRMSAAAWG